MLVGLPNASVYLAYLISDFMILSLCDARANVASVTNFGISKPLSCSCIGGPPGASPMLEPTHKFFFGLFEGFFFFTKLRTGIGGPPGASPMLERTREFYFMLFAVLFRIHFRIRFGPAYHQTVAGILPPAILIDNLSLKLRVTSKSARRRYDEKTHDDAGQHYWNGPF